MNKKLIISSAVESSTLLLKIIFLFNIINTKSFRILFNQQSERLLDESHFRRVLPEVFAVVKMKLKRGLEQMPICLFLTANGITNDWNRKKYVLAVRKFSEAHTGKNISKKLVSLIEEWSVADKIHCFVTDGARNVQKHTLCAAHQINLIVKNSIVEKEGEILKLFGRCRRIVGHIRHSNKAFTELKKEIQEFHELPSHQLIQEVSTRWNSSLIMVRRLIEQRKAIDDYLIENKMIDLFLSDKEWKLLEALVNLLTPFEEVSKLFCASPLSVVIPYAKQMERDLRAVDLTVSSAEEECIKITIIELESLRNSAISGIKDRFLIMEHSRIYCLATFLDPRFKHNFSQDPLLFINKVSYWIKEEINESNIEIDELLLGQCDVVISEPPTKKSFLDSLEEQQNINVIDKPNDLDEEIQSYVVNEKASQRSDPLDWWRKNHKKASKVGEISSQIFNNAFYKCRKIEIQSINSAQKRINFLNTFKSVIIIECGSRLTRVGFCDDKLPIEIFRTPPLFCKKLNNAQQHQRIIKFFKHIVSRKLNVSFRSRRIIIVESLLTPTWQRQALAHALFDCASLAPHSLLFAPSHLLCSFPFNARTCIVLDLGANEAVLFPIVEGILMLNDWGTSAIACASALESEAKRLMLKYGQVRRRPVLIKESSEDDNGADNLIYSDDGRPFAECDLALADSMRLWEDLVFRFCFVTTADRGRLTNPDSPLINRPVPPVQIQFGAELLYIPGIVRVAVAELLFTNNDEIGCRSVPQLILDCISRVSIDLRRELLQNLLIVGGISRLPGFLARLKTELVDLIADEYKIKLSSDITDIKFYQFPREFAGELFCAWLGGSMLGSLDYIVDQRSITRQEWFKTKKVKDWTDEIDNYFSELNIIENGVEGIKQRIEELIYSTQTIFFKYFFFFNKPNNL
ncbi:hypothetical protein Mgra_00006129 [Meloidogyne graminicola]|uniref:Uncharacterized protein n=1 Tax=Meloidogyne graminicola TaxID=189291 RepID=A0A8S9ZM57_9BILA|nr:hypothetical protein Mgra_00006129 [Meloidogyne graminicola]